MNSEFTAIFSGPLKRYIIDVAELQIKYRMEQVFYPIPYLYVLPLMASLAVLEKENVVLFFPKPSRKHFLAKTNHEIQQFLVLSDSKIQLTCKIVLGLNFKPQL